MDAFVGSVEVLTHDGASIGIPGTHWTADAVPVVVGTVAGITDLTEVDPEQRPTGRTPEAQWTGHDAAGFDVTVLLWKQRPDDLIPVGFANPEDGEG